MRNISLYLAIPLITLLAGCFGSSNSEPAHSPPSGEGSSGGGSGGSGGGSGGDGGSGGGSGGGSAPFTTEEMRAQVIGRAQAGRSIEALRKLDAEGLDTWLNNVETQVARAKPEAGALRGSASYEGRAMGVSDEDEGSEVTYRAGVKLDANFDTGKLTGTLENFAIYDALEDVKEDISGTLAVNGNISEDKLTATVNGDLRGESDFAVTADGTMNGIFVQENAARAIGTIDLSTSGGETFTGVFRASKP